MREYITGGFWKQGLVNLYKDEAEFFLVFLDFDWTRRVQRVATDSEMFAVRLIEATTDFIKNPKEKKTLGPIVVGAYERTKREGGGWAIPLGTEINVYLGQDDDQAFRNALIYFQTVAQQTGIEDDYRVVSWYCGCDIYSNSSSDPEECQCEGVAVVDGYVFGTENSLNFDCPGCGALLEQSGDHFPEMDLQLDSPKEIRVYEIDPESDGWFKFPAGFQI